jgi:hypothetical protein
MYVAASKERVWLTKDALSDKEKGEKSYVTNPK